MSEAPWLSIAIATMKRWDFLKDTLPTMLDRPEVGEIVICDETGEDVAAIRLSPFAQNPKLRLVVNDRRLGIYENKLKAMRLCTLPWIGCFDSDNVFPDGFFDCLSEVEREPKTLYASAYFLRIDQRTGETSTPTAAFSGTVVDAAAWNRFFQDREAFQNGWIHLVNDGNWVLPRDAVAALPTTVKSTDVYAADAIFMLREWLGAGYRISYVPDLRYIHLVHGGSSWLAMEAESEAVLGSRDWGIKN